MAGQDRQPNRDLEFTALLEAEPERFGFFEALRRLERVHADQPRVGHAKRASDEPLRLGQYPYLRFPSAEIQAFEPGEGDDADRLYLYALGLFGPNGPLPLHYTLDAQERLEHQHDPSLMRFVNLLQHRLLSFMYRAYAEAEPAVQADRPETNCFDLYIGALCGLGLSSQADRDCLPDDFKRRHVAHLAMRTRPPAVIRAMIEDFFELPADIEEFVGGWISIPNAFQCRLGDRHDSARLGQGAVLGAKSCQRQHRARLRLGPMDLSTYRSLLPGKQSFAQIDALLRLTGGDELEWDVNFILKQDRLTSARLAATGLGDPNFRLGWTSWLGPRSTSEDADDLILPLSSSGHQPIEECWQ